MEQIQQLIDNITRSLAELGSLLQQNRATLALLSTIPPVVKGHETEPIEVIEPLLCSGQEAVSAAAAAFQDLKITPPWSQKSTRRYVGAIQLPTTNPASAHIVTLVQRINRDKAMLEQIITETFPTRSLRFAAIRECAHGVMTKHLYRQILCFDQQEIRSIRFSWQRKDTVIKADAVKIASLIESIRCAHAIASDDAKLPLEQLMENIAMVKPANIRIRYPVKVQPAANVVSISPPDASRISRPDQVTTEGAITTKGYMKTYNAPLPILIVQDEPLVAEPIGIFNARGASARKPRADKQPSQLVGTFSGIQIEQLK